MASRVNMSKTEQRVMLIKFSCESDQQDAEAGVPVIIKPEWKEPEKP